MNEPGPLLVSAADITRVYGEGEAAVHALDGVTVGFPRGRFTAIMGPSGSGKSTLMHILAGLDRPTSGSVILDGVEIAELDDRKLTELRRERVGFVFQSFNLLPVLDARENIVLPLSIAGKRPDAEWLDTPDRDRRPRRPPRPPALRAVRRPAAARRRRPRAGLASPAVVFADEPTGNLDSKSSAELLDLLRRSVDEFGQTVVMVTHDPTAAAYADRLLVLADGVIVHDGEAHTADDVLDLMKAVG